MIRRAQLADTGAIRDLIVQLGYAAPPLLEEKIGRLIGHPDEVLLVYEVEDEVGAGSGAEVGVGPGIGVDAGSGAEVVAFLSLHFIPQIAVGGDFARISYFAVGEKARGLGIGGQLEAYVTGLARERNCDRIEVHCHSRRTDAHRFYERQGYEESPKYFIKRLTNPGL